MSKTQFLRPLHLACLDDDMRPNFKLIQIRGGIARATNGSMIVKVDLNIASTLEPEQIEILNGKYIHMNVWKEICKCESLDFDDDGIYCHINDIDKTFGYSNPNGEFFDLDHVLEDVFAAGEEPKRMISLNPDYIEIISKIFDGYQMFFSFSPDNKGVIIFPGEGSGMFALLMPMAAEGVNRYFFRTPKNMYEEAEKHVKDQLKKAGVFDDVLNQIHPEKFRVNHEGDMPIPLE